MDRREFFKHGVSSLKKTVVEKVEKDVNAQAAHWIRPPFACAEMEFLLSCSRCKACVEACPYGVIFLLPLRSGVKATGTPALDLLHKACHLCANWPCVSACKPAALYFPDSEDGRPESQLPNLAVARVETALCLPFKGPECGACEGSCPVPGALLWKLGKPTIEAEHCVGCALCRLACVLEDKAISIHSPYQFHEQH
ncbi:MAG TPA: hypothetical protein ENI62_02940 [Gammaproteobacteria bacterium]|nr:hypothetical protein [Gammaproteobacteria bacterium]